MTMSATAICAGIFPKAEKFIEDRISGFDGTPYSLVVREKRAREYPEIMALTKVNACSRVGDFLVVDVERVPLTE